MLNGTWKSRRDRCKKAATIMKDANNDTTTVTNKALLVAFTTAATIKDVVKVVFLLLTNICTVSFIANFSLFIYCVVLSVFLQCLYFLLQYYDMAITVSSMLI